MRLKRTPFLLAVIAVAAIALLAAGPAYADLLAPKHGGSPNADKIFDLYTITGIMGLVVLIGVEGLIIYCVVKFRRKGRGAPEPVAVHGNAPLEIGWTIGAIALVGIVATITFLFLPGILNPSRSDANGLQRSAGVPYAEVGQPAPPGGAQLRIHVNGQQYIWRFDYVGEKPLTEGRPVYAYTDMYVPIHTTVTLKIYSSDVDHSWWIPQLGGKADAVPGHTNQTWFKISKPGIYTGQCAELCGENHADMRARVIALPVDQYQTWVANQRKNILASQQALAQQRKNGQGDPTVQAHVQAQTK